MALERPQPLIYYYYYSYYYCTTPMVMFVNKLGKRLAVQLVPGSARGLARLWAVGLAKSIVALSCKLGVEKTCHADLGPLGYKRSLSCIGDRR